MSHKVNDQFLEHMNEIMVDMFGEGGAEDVKLFYNNSESAEEAEASDAFDEAYGNLWDDTVNAINAR